MKNAIITGATSFLGLAVIELLLKNNIDVFAVVRPNSQNLERLPKTSQLNVIELNITDISNLSKTEAPPFDVFYHFAWDGTRAAARDDMELQERNYLVTMDAVKTAVALGCHTFIGAGSQAEYGLLSGKIDEESLAKPLTAYGKAKLRACYDGQKFAMEHGMHFIWPRIFSLYGIYDYENTLIMSCLRKMLQHEAVDLTACTQMWDFLNVKDAAQALYHMGVSENAEGIYNIASGESRLLKDFVLEMAQITNSKSPLNFGAIPYSPGGAVSFEPVISRLMQEFKWSPQITFKQGIYDILYHMERHG